LNFWRKRKAITESGQILSSSFFYRTNVTVIQSSTLRNYHLLAKLSVWIKLSSKNSERECKSRLFENEKQTNWKAQLDSFECQLKVIKIYTLYPSIKNCQICSRFTFCFTILWKEQWLSQYPTTQYKNELKEQPMVKEGLGMIP